MSWQAYLIWETVWLYSILAFNRSPYLIFYLIYSLALIEIQITTEWLMYSTPPTWWIDSQCKDASLDLPKRWKDFLISALNVKRSNVTVVCSLNTLLTVVQHNFLSTFYQNSLASLGRSSFIKIFPSNIRAFFKSLIQPWKSWGFLLKKWNLQLWVISLVEWYCKILNTSHGHIDIVKHILGGLYSGGA